MADCFHVPVVAVVWAFCVGGSSWGADHRLGDRFFSFPDGYTLEVAAGPPLVERPMEADFDDRGVLYVTESSGSNEPVDEQLKKRPHRVLRLVDADGDGVFDGRTVFADGLMFPEGCLWHEGSLYVAAPPQIWKLTDGDGDGVAEKREVWFDGGTLTGCANDLHGPYRGPDGLIYWSKGAFAEQSYDLPGRPGWKSRASHVFRAKAGAAGPEGIEPVFTAGMDNPVGLAWTPEGELIVSGTFFQHPGGGRRDGLIHAVRGGVWGKDHEVLDGHPRTGGLLPPMTHLGPAAPAGLARYGRDLLCAQFNMRKVSRHELRSEGATYQTADSDFLSCDHPDFHPTDVLQAPDGSVLVIDTGGWYKLCCPTSQLAKPQVLGAIYRLRRTGGEVPVESPRPAWPVVDSDDDAALISRLGEASLQVRRQAAEALGRRGRAEAVPALLGALAAADVDRFLFHACAHALLEIGEVAGTRAGLGHEVAAVRAAVLYALEQMPGGGLTAAEVVPLLAAADGVLGEAVLFVIERHAEWAGELVSWLRGQLAGPAAGGEAARRILLALGGREPVRRLMADELAAGKPEVARVQVLGAMAALRPAPWPDDWRDGVARVLAGGSEAERGAALEVVAAMGSGERGFFAESLAVVAGEAGAGAGVRLRALEVSGGSLPGRLFDWVVGSLDDPWHRGAAARVLAVSRLEPGQLRVVAAMVSGAGVLERPFLLRCFAGHSDEAAGLALVAGLGEARVLAATPAEVLGEVMSGFPASVQRALAEAQAALKPADRTARLEELERSLPPGDVERGLIVFQSARAACAVCHPVGYKGGDLGPDLSRVGAIRTRRDLLEAIVFPSASFVRSYEPVQITRGDGSVVYGTVRSQGGGGVTVATGAGLPEVRVGAGEIAAMVPGVFSLMPEGMDQVLTEQELSDVVAYLQSRR